MRWIKIREEIRGKLWYNTDSKKSGKQLSDVRTAAFLMGVEATPAAEGGTLSEGEGLCGRKI